MIPVALFIMFRGRARGDGSDVADIAQAYRKITEPSPLDRLVRPWDVAAL